MGAKTSTANGGNGTASSGPHHQHHVHSQQHNPQSPRTRTFSSSSSSATEVIPGGSAVPAGFSLLRSIPGMHVSAINQSTIDRQRARSLSSVPDLQQSNGNGTTQSNYLNGKLIHKSIFSIGSMCNFFFDVIKLTPVFVMNNVSFPFYLAIVQ